MAEKFDFQTRNNDDKTLTFTVKDSNSSAVDITGATVRWRLARESFTSAKITKSSTAGSSEISTTGSTAGKFVVTLVPSDSENLVGVYYHEAELEDSQGEKFTVSYGHATFHRTLI